MPRPKRLDWAAPALDELAEGLAYIAEDSLAAAIAVKQRIDLAVDRIRRDPGGYEEGVAPGSRECVVARTAFTLIFEDRGDSILILHC